MRRRARIFFGLVSTALCLVVASCGLNPQPEPPSAEETSGSGGAAGAPNEGAAGGPVAYDPSDPGLREDDAGAPPPSRGGQAFNDESSAGFDLGGSYAPGADKHADGGTHEDEDADAGRPDPEVPDAGGAVSL